MKSKDHQAIKRFTSQGTWNKAWSSNEKSKEHQWNEVGAMKQQAYTGPWKACTI